MAGADDPWWKELTSAVAFFGIFLAGWALAIVLAIVVLVLVLT